MKLHTQRDTLFAGLTEIHAEVRDLIISIDRKMAAPYGDGTRSNMVNASTDVLPRLYEMRREIDRLLDSTETDNEAYRRIADRLTRPTETV